MVFLDRLKSSLLKHRTRLYLYLSKFLNQKQYWNIAGKIIPTDAILDGYFELDDFFATGKNVVSFFEKQKMFTPRSTTLHIGCGIGRVERYLAPKVKQCFGVDIAETMIAQAKNYVKTMNTSFLATDGQSLPFPGNYFDFVYSILVFQHMPKNMFINNLKEVNRVLKPGGKFFFQIPIDEEGIKGDPPSQNPWLMRYYKNSEIVSLLSRYRFEIIKTFDDFAESESSLRADLKPNFSFLTVKKRPSATIKT